VAENIDCDFCAWTVILIVAEDGGKDDLEKELETARNLGFNQIERAARAPIKDFDTGECLRFPRQGQFHVLKYLSVWQKPSNKTAGDYFQTPKPLNGRAKTRRK
jgi:hypothetical protein